MAAAPLMSHYLEDLLAQKPPLWQQLNAEIHGSAVTAGGRAVLRGQRGLLSRPSCWAQLEHPGSVLAVAGPHLSESCPSFAFPHGHAMNSSVSSAQLGRRKAAPPNLPCCWFGGGRGRQKQ